MASGGLSTPGACSKCRLSPGIVRGATGRILYLEEGELLIPPNFLTTANEKRAGFP